jgi:hypothetical protein
MAMRGVEKPGAVTATAAYTGAFTEGPDFRALRAEFLAHARSGGGAAAPLVRPAVAGPSALRTRCAGSGSGHNDSSSGGATGSHGDDDHDR